MVQRKDTSSADWKFGFNSRWVHWNKRKVAGYGLPGRTANACHPKGDEGSNPLPSAYGSMVKRTSCLASNEKFRVQILVGLLEEMTNDEIPNDERKTKHE